jgi:hypothetical protein
MQPFLLDFELVTMNAEIGSYQEDQDPEREPGEASPEPPRTEPDHGAAGA